MRSSNDSRPARELLPVGFDGGHTLSDLQAALVALQDGGASHDEAVQTILADPSITGRMADQIAAVRQRFDDEVKAREAQVVAASPEGRRRAAEAALKAEQEHAKTLEGARAMLRAEGVDPEGMPEREILTASGIEKRTRGEMSLREWDQEVEQLAANVSRMSDDEAIAEARRLDVDLTSIASYVENFGEGDAS